MDQNEMRLDGLVREYLNGSLSLELAAPEILALIRSMPISLDLSHVPPKHRERALALEERLESFDSA